MTVTTQDFKTGKMSLFDMFRYYSKINLPEYQRDYSWDSEQVVRLLDDIDDLAKDPKDNLFLGQFVFANNKKGNVPSPVDPDQYAGGNVELIDGQQRITTITLIYHVVLSRLCSEYHPHYERAKYYMLDSLDLSGSSFPNDTTGNIKDRIFERLSTKRLQSILLKEGWEGMSGPKLCKLVKFENNKHKELWKIMFGNECNHKVNIDKFTNDENDKSLGDIALNLAYETINERVSSLPDEIFFQNWVVNLFNLDANSRIHLTIMHASNPTAGIEIFYGINALGKQLDPADLIKASIYSAAKKQKTASSGSASQFMHRWEELETKIVKAFSSSTTSPFIEYLTLWVIADSGKETTQKKLFESFKELDDQKKYLKDSAKIKGLFDRLEVDSDLYIILRQKGKSKSLFNESNVTNSKTRNQLNEIIVRLNLFLGPRAVQHIPILLASFNRLKNKNEIRKLSIPEKNATVFANICELMLTLMGRFQMANIEAKTLRPRLMTILRELIRTNIDKDNIYKCIHQNAKQRISGVDLDDDERDRFSIDSSNQNTTYEIPVVRDSEIRNFLSGDLTRPSQTKHISMIKAVMWELEYRNLNSQRRTQLLKSGDNYISYKSRSEYQGDHICPKDCEQHWKPLYDTGTYNGLLSQRYVIGNYMLLFASDNASARNKPLSEKVKSIYKDRYFLHEHLINKLTDENLVKREGANIKIINKDSLNKFWSIDHINELTEWYIDNILKAWKY